MTNYIQHQKTADEVVADLDGQITERLARNFGNMTLWHADAATLLRRYREMAGEISTLRAQQETDRATIASLSGASEVDALRDRATELSRIAMGNGREISRLTGLTWALGQALRDLTRACELADAHEELAEEVDGSLLDAANKALALLSPDPSNTQAQKMGEG
jgi:hypothetical protein